MKLLIDAGNTRIKWALSDPSSDKIVNRGVFDSGFDGVAHDAVDSVWVSSVASESVVQELREHIFAEFSLEPNVVEVVSQLAGMVNKYRDLPRLGVDRWVAALGARSIYPQGSLIVVDAGTAVTIDLVSNVNNFEGGVILPGFVSMHDALLGRAAGVRSERRIVDSVLGRNTQDCVNAGVQYGLIGAIDRVVSDMVDLSEQEACESGQEVIEDCRILLMGGDADAIQAATTLKLELQLDMIFNGLILISKL